MTADEYRAATDNEARDIFGEAEREGVTDLEQVRSMAVRYHEWAERDELYRQATVHGLRQADLHDTAPRMRVADAIREHREGLELQAGLEEAVRRTRADLEANPDIEVV